MSGEVDGVAWRLLRDTTSPEQGALCLETLDAGVADLACSGYLAPDPQERTATTRTPFLEEPSMTDGARPFLFGQIGFEVAQVVAESDAGGSVAATVSQESDGTRLRFFVVALPLGTSSTTAVAYTVDGKEIARHEVSSGDACAPQEDGSRREPSVIGECVRHRSTSGRGSSTG